MTTKRQRWIKEADDIVALQNCDVGCACEFETTYVMADDRRWKATKASTPCEACCFHDRKLKAIKNAYSIMTQCPYIRGCMAHLRRDGKSVAFIEVEFTPVSKSKL